MRKTLRIALSGGIASGKTMACAYFAEQGAAVIDADQLARELLKPGTAAYRDTVALFGTDILLDDRQLNRPLLRRIIWSDTGKRKQLESLLHPLVDAQMEQQYQKLRAEYCIFCIPLLLETAAQRKYARIAIVDVSPATQVERLITRDQHNREEAENMIRIQAERRARLRIADDIIRNDGDLDALRRRVTALHHLYLQLARSAADEKNRPTQVQR